jgi:tetratricopeptide (TPR) repeat protein
MDKTAIPVNEVPNNKASFAVIIKKAICGFIGLVIFLCFAYILVNPEGAYCIRGTIYTSLDQYDLAIAACNKAIDLDPELAIAYNNRGKAYYYKGQYDLAIKDYNKAIELDPELKVAYYMKGIILSSRFEKKKEAIECFNKFLQYATPGNPLIEIAEQRIKTLGGTTLSN